MRFTTDIDIIGDAPPTPTPPEIPPQGAPGVDPANASCIPTAISAAYAVAYVGQEIAILDIGPPSDIVGDTWIRQHPQLIISPLQKSSNRFAQGCDVPDTLGRLGLRLPTTTAAGDTLYLDFPDLHLMRYNTVLLLLGFSSHQRLRIVVEAFDCSIKVGTRRTRINCQIHRGHLTSRRRPHRPQT